MRSIQKRGVLGLDAVKGVILSLMIIAVLAVASALALVSLKNSSIFTVDSLEYNQTTNIINNVTSAQAGFFASSGTIFSILVAVVIILAIAIIVGVVSRFGGSGQTNL